MVVWVGSIDAGWTVIADMENDLVRVWASDAAHSNWFGEGNREELTTRAQVEGGAVARLRNILEGSSPGRVYIDETGVLKAEIPFGRGSVVAARLTLQRGGDFADRMRTEHNAERERRIWAEKRLLETEQKCSELEQALLVCRDAKEGLEEKMLTSFIAILNEKKRKIAELQRGNAARVESADAEETERRDDAISDGHMSTQEEDVRQETPTKDITDQTPLEDLL
mmetsp:Transcript_9040/g.27176  ORF Transcript_9040/g.27176 Transcript_9040/m.27176 type:complete len:225 (-) Transcript_9040:1421-2095(-)